MHGDPEHLETLHNQRESEHYRKAPPEYIELLLKTVERDPSDLGYEFGRWTAERLATYLNEQTGIELSSSQVRRILKRKKYSYIWAKSSLEDKQNPRERAEFQERIAKYLAIARKNPELVQVWFWDESGFSLRVIRRKNWGKKGQWKKITGQRRRGRFISWVGCEKQIANGYVFLLKKAMEILFISNYNG